MAAVKTVQVMLLAERDFPVFSARGADPGFETVFQAFRALNPGVPVEGAILAVWEEGLRSCLAKTRQRRFPGRLAALKVVVQPPKPRNPRPAP
jgi:hypothetical protein